MAAVGICAGATGRRRVEREGGEGEMNKDPEIEIADLRREVDALCKEIDRLCAESKRLSDDLHTTRQELNATRDRLGVALSPY